MAADKAGIILAVYTTSADVHDSKGVVPSIEKVRTRHRQEVSADKGYKWKVKDDLFAVCGSQSHIMNKGYRNRPMNRAQSAENREISSKRWVVEWTYGSLEWWFVPGSTQLKGLQMVFAVHMTEATAYNLKRFPRIAASMG